ncbi:GNAT family N-acetyltransferase [Gilvimarinus chinensis]|uniref:GNAT family N-acetyltransferase n=1 Tax=Gilvimarinus chinensis TaxID=396005 RepID=UPI000375A5B2|nr:GNAT family N-acetyltransferase [Gilvimarinus chinensis]
MIETVAKENVGEILPLFRAYQEFYHVQNICDDRNKRFLSQFCDTPQLGGQFMWRKNGSVVAFATVYFTYTSTIAAKVAILNDLYTRPENRGEGIGRRLLEHCREFAQQHGAARLQWVTSPENTAAQKLYDSLGLDKSQWYFYSYPCS